MKIKNKLLIFLGIFIFMIIPKNVNALTYNKCGEDIQVNENNFIYYLYQNNTELFENSNDFIFFKYKDGTGYTIYFSSQNFDFKVANTINGTYSIRGANRYKFDLSFNMTGPTTYGPNSYGSHTGFNENLYFSSFDIYNQGNSSFFDSNLTKEDLKSYFTCSQKITYYMNDEEYLTFNVPKGSSHHLYDYSIPEGFSFSGWSYDPSVDITNIQSDISIYGYLSEVSFPDSIEVSFPITKNEYYVLLILLGTLILMLFLKWCYPFKSGSDLK